MNGSFIQNLGKVYALYTGAFLIFVILMAILERLGSARRRSASCSWRSPSPSTP